MTTKLVFTLDTALQWVIQEKQYSAVACNAKVFYKIKRVLSKNKKLEQVLLEH